MKTPNGPKGLPLLGSVLLLRHGIIKFAVELGSYGDVSYARLVGTHTYMLNHPDLIEELLVGLQRHLVKPAAVLDMSILIGNGLITSDGEHWLRQRRLAAPTMQAKRITGYADIIVDCTERLVQGLRDDEVRDMYEDLSHLTLEIASKTLLGVDEVLDTRRISRGVDALNDYFERQINSYEALIPKRIPTPTRRRLARGRADLDEIIFRIIDRCRSSETQADHLLGRLLRVRDEDGKPMSDAQVRDEAATMLLAGYETTALTLTYGVHLLAQHPEVVTRLCSDLDRVLAGRPPAVADLKQLPYLDAVVRETLRLYPPVLAIGREVVESFELGGYTIPRGAQIMCSPYVMQRDPRYFRDPSAFRPERWLAPEIASLPRFAYFPFSGGPRICIGNHFAMLEACLVLASLMSRVKLEHTPGFRLDTASTVSLRPRHGLPMRVRLRARPENRSSALDRSASLDATANEAARGTTN